MEYIIVGCGVFGLSTALSLIKEGVKPNTIAMFDVYEPPSPWSAACDFNKIIRCEYNKELYTKLSIEALKEWREDPLFNRSYVECGRVLVTPMSHQGRIEYEREGIENLKKYGYGLKYKYWRGGEELGKLFESFSNNSIPMDKEVKWNPESGIGKSGETLVDVYEYLKYHGVIFQFGEENGRIIKVDEETVINGNGESFEANNILLSLGANTGKVVNLENQQSATGLFVTHIQLTDDEYEKYKDIPVIFDGDMGYFFQPDKETKRMKICLNGGGIKRTIESKFDNSKNSLPRFKSEYPGDTIPKERVIEVYEILNQYVPELANHEIVDHKICWIGDTIGGNFLIDKVPNFERVFVATGDSGHGFKFFPNIGKYIYQMMNEGLDDNEMIDSWSWKDRRTEPMVDPAQNKWRITKGTRDISEIDFY